MQEPFRSRRKASPRQGLRHAGIWMVSPGRLRKAIPPDTSCACAEGPSRDDFTCRGRPFLGLSVWPRHGDPTSISLTAGACSGEGPGEGGLNIFRLSRARVAVLHG